MSERSEKVKADALCEFKAEAGDVCEDCGRRLSDGESQYFFGDGNECDDGTYVAECCVLKWVGA